MSFGLGSVYADVELRDNGFTSGIRNAGTQIDQLQNQASGLSATLKGAVVGGLAALGTALLGIGVAGIKANSDMEQYRATLNTVMGDSLKAGQTLDWVKQYAAQTPFEMPGLVEATVKLQAMGLKAQEFLPIAGDMAAVFKSSGKDVNDAAEAINDAMMGEFERLKEFGIKLQQTDFKEGGKYAGKTYAEALKAEFENHNYAGAADALSKTFAGRLSTLKDTFSGFMSGATQPIFDKLSVGMGNLLDKINKLQQDGTLAKWQQGLSSALTTVWNVVETTGKVIFAVGKGIADNWGIIAPIVSGVVAGFTAFKTISFVVTLFNTLKTAWMALSLSFSISPIGWIAIAIGAIVAAGVALYQNWDTVSKYAGIAWTAIKDAIKVSIDFIAGLWESAKTTALSVWNSIKDGVKVAVDFLVGLFLNFTPVGLIIKHWDTIKKVFQVGALFIKEIFKVAVEFVTGLVKAWGIADFVSGVWNKIKSVTTTVWNAITSWIKTTFDKIKNNVTTILNTVFNFISNIWNNIKNTTSTVFNAIHTFITSIWNKVLNTIKPIISNVLNFIVNIWNNIKNNTSTVFNAVFSVISSIWNKVYGTVNGIVTNIWNRIVNVFNNIKSTVVGVFDTVVNTISSKLESAKKIVSSAIDKIKSFFSNAGLKFPNIPLPHFSINGKFSLNPPSVPSLGVKWYQQGTNYAPGGWAVVGDGGPELVNLGRGSQVVPNRNVGDYIVKALKPMFDDFISKFKFVSPNEAIKAVQNTTVNNSEQKTITYSPTINLNVEGDLDESKFKKFIEMAKKELGDDFYNSFMKAGLSF